MNFTTHSCFVSLDLWCLRSNDKNWIKKTNKTYPVPRPMFLCGFLVVFILYFIFIYINWSWGANWKKAHHSRLRIPASLCGDDRHVLLEEGGGEERVSCNHIYVGSHSICHSTFHLTCHIANHYSGLNAGYELKRPGKAPLFFVFFVLLNAVFVCIWRAMVVMILAVQCLLDVFNQF